MRKNKLKLKIHFGKVSAILAAAFAVLLTADLVLKFCEEKYGWNFTVIPKFIWVESGCRNTGAAFSFLADTEWGRIFFIVLTFIMFFVMVAAFLLLPEKFVGLKTALAMISAGALGNLVDRLAFGYVRDFVWMNLFGSYACCNFADFWIVLGVILAIIDVLFINDWAVFPLTKSAKAAAKARENAQKQDGQDESAVTADENAPDLTKQPTAQPESEDKEDREDGGEE